MLRSLKAMLDYKVCATDNDIGSVHDFLFDGKQWAVRYLAVDTGNFWKGPGQVLISPLGFGRVDWETRTFFLGLTRDKVNNSPHIGVDAKVTRAYEREYFRYYAWPFYWGYGNVWGEWECPAILAKSAPSAGKDDAEGDGSCLVSMRMISGYRILGSDEEIGHVQDFIVDDESWVCRYLVVDTRNWWHGKSVVLAAHWIEEVDHKAKTVMINLPRDVIRKSPEWHPDLPVNREYEMRLYDYYGRPVYWPDEKKSDQA